MNKQPVYYLQKDSRWALKPYRAKGENSTVGSAGCGPTCAAMCIETLTGKTFTPLDACNWSMEHGYKALNQGTYYSYFKPQLAAFGIDCDMLNWTNTYGKPNHENHKKAVDMLKQGYYLIALMNKGTWTTSGHFVLVWWSDDKVRINDPASQKEYRINGDLYDFRSQVKYYWWVDARAYNNKKEDELDMTVQEFVDKLTDEQAYTLLQKAQKHAATLPLPNWAEEEMNDSINYGITDGSRPMALTMRYETAIMTKRAKK